MDYRKLAEEFYAFTLGKKRVPASARLDGMSKGEVAVLEYLAGHQEAAPGEISDYQGITTARVANILAGLERKKLVVRAQDAEDRRKVIVKPTEKGIELARIKKEECIRDMSRMLEALGEKDAPEFLRLQIRAREILDGLFAQK